MKRTTASLCALVVSGDGKTRTVTQTGTNAQGQALNVSSVYERQ